MKNRLISGAVSASLLTAAMLPTGCGYFLHPERRGNSGGSVDAGTLVMDLLWLIPGIVPGVIALVVDFSSGAIYVGGGRRASIDLSPKGNIAVRVPASKTPTNVEFRFTREDESVVVVSKVRLRPNANGQIVELQLAPTLRNEKLYLEVVSTDATPATVAAKR